MKVVIVGDGAFGSALFTVLSKNSPVSYYKKGEKIEDGSLVVLAVPTQAVRAVLTNLKSIKNVLLVNCAKGIEQKSHKFPFEIAQEVLGEHIEYFSLIGPSFAEEVKEEMPTLVNLGFVQEKRAEEIRRLFQTDYFRVHLTEGVEALELSGAFKNVYAIACGIGQGLGFGVNTRVKLILLAMEEITKLTSALGFSLEADATPGTIGDLILTCNSEESRNFRFGELLTRYPAKEALEKVNATVEGFNTVYSVEYFAKKTGLTLSLARFVHAVVLADNPKEVKVKFEEFVREV